MIDYKYARDFNFTYFIEWSKHNVWTNKTNSENLWIFNKTKFWNNSTRSKTLRKKELCKI